MRFAAKCAARGLTTYIRSRLCAPSARGRTLRLSRPRLVQDATETIETCTRVSRLRVLRWRALLREERLDGFIARFHTRVECSRRIVVEFMLALASPVAAAYLEWDLGTIIGLDVQDVLDALRVPEIAYRNAPREDCDAHSRQLRPAIRGAELDPRVQGTRRRAFGVSVEPRVFEDCWEYAINYDGVQYPGPCLSRCPTVVFWTILTWWIWRRSWPLRSAACAWTRTCAAWPRAMCDYVNMFDFGDDCEHYFQRLLITGSFANCYYELLRKFGGSTSDPSTRWSSAR